MLFWSSSVAVVAVGDVVPVDAADDIVGHEAVEPVAVGHAVLDEQVQGLLMRVEAITRAVHHLHPRDMDVEVLLRASGPDARIEAVDLAARCRAVAIDGEIEDPDIGGDLIERGAHHAGDVACRPVDHLEDRLAHAGALERGASEHGDGAVTLLTTSFDEKGACRQGDRDPTCGWILDIFRVCSCYGCIDRGGIVIPIVGICTETRGIENGNHAEILSSGKQASMLKRLCASV